MEMVARILDIAKVDIPVNPWPMFQPPARVPPIPIIIPPRKADNSSLLSTGGKRNLFKDLALKNEPMIKPITQSESHVILKRKYEFIKLYRLLSVLSLRSLYT